MAADQPLIGVVVAEDAPVPPGLEPLMAEARVEIVRSHADLDAILPHVSVLGVYDFRTHLLHQADMTRAERLEWVHAASAGVDAVLVPEIVSSNTVVTNSRGVFDPGIAEYVLGLMLLAAKDFHTTLALQREERWQHRESMLLRGKRLLVVGAGSIGSAIGRLAASAGLEVAGIARTARDDEVFGQTYATADLHQHLGTADFVVVATPLTRETHGLFDDGAFEAMKRGAWFINIGRGPIVDEDALLRALESGHLGGAALDVFVEEPLPAGHPFWQMPNVVVSPHMAGDIHGWEEELGARFVENFRRWRRGEELQNRVNKEAAAAQQVTDDRQRQ